MLMSDGTMYGCGDNTSGQIPGETESTVVVGWKKLLPQVRVVDIACGWEFTVIVTSQGEVKSCGNGPKGELGVSEKVNRTRVLQKIGDYKGKVFASLQNCALVTRDEQGLGSSVYMWGSNTKCQIQSPKSRKICEPTLVFKSEAITISYVAMGKDFAILVDSNGHIVKCLGLLPQGFDMLDWSGACNLQVSCMWSSVHIGVRGDYYFKSIHSYGNCQFSQAFQMQEWLSHKYPDEEILDFTTGSEHGVLILQNTITKRSRVACWGWGEHGNCGRTQESKNSRQNPVNDYSNISSALNTICRTDKTARLYAGCATTWVILED